MEHLANSQVKSNMWGMGYLLGTLQSAIIAAQPPLGVGLGSNVERAGPVAVGGLHDAKAL